MPTVITAFKSKADLVRQVAAELGVTYEEEEVPEREDLVKFRFKDKDDAMTYKLVMAIPREAYAKRMLLGGESLGSVDEGGHA